MRVLQHRSRDLAEIQHLAGGAADAHYNQIITPEARLSQDGILGCNIDTQEAVVVAGSRRHSFQENRMERKAIQIVAYADHLYPLCDDGATSANSRCVV